MCGPDCIMPSRVHAEQSPSQKLSVSSLSESCVLIYLAVPLNQSTIDTSMKGKRTKENSPFALVRSGAAHRVFLISVRVD